MSQITWRVDDIAVLRARFLSAAGALVDPTTVTFKVRTASGVTTTYTYSGGGVTKDSTGQYSRTVTLTEAGVWAFKVASTGTPTKSEETTIRVVGSDYGL